MTTKSRGLPLYSKLILYGLCGFFTEIVFTAVWYLIDPKYSTYGGWKLHGCTSLWSFPIYSISIYILELLSKAIKPKLVLPLRVVIYVVWTYMWEFSTGWVLTQLNACPWNYEDYTSYHLYGLITLDYAPLWMVATVLCEKVVIATALRLEYVEEEGEGEGVREKSE